MKHKEKGYLGRQSPKSNNQRLLCTQPLGCNQKKYSMQGVFAEIIPHNMRCANAMQCCLPDSLYSYMISSRTSSLPFQNLP